MNEFKQSYLKAVLERDDLQKLSGVDNLTINMHNVFGIETWPGLIVRFNFSKLMKEMDNQIPNGGIPIRSIGMTNLYKLQTYMLTHVTTDNYSLRSFHLLWQEILRVHKQSYATSYSLMDIRQTKDGNVSILTRNNILSDSSEITSYICNFKDLFVTSIIKYII